MKKIVSFLVVAILVFTSCVSISPTAIKADSLQELPKIQETYKFRIEKTQIGMDIADFILLWPEVKKIAESNNSISFEFLYIQTYYTTHDKKIGVWWTGSVKTSEYIQRINFYFIDKKLDKYEYTSNK